MVGNLAVAVSLRMYCVAETPVGQEGHQARATEWPAATTPCVLREDGGGRPIGGGMVLAELVNCGKRGPGGSAERDGVDRIECERRHGRNERGRRDGGSAT